eukprot:scaffold17198_cov119-Isochrysis_galbana.AAC.5
MDPGSGTNSRKIQAQTPRGVTVGTLKRGPPLRVLGAVASPVRRCCRSPAAALGDRGRRASAASAPPLLPKPQAFRLLFGWPAPRLARRSRQPVTLRLPVRYAIAPPHCARPSSSDGCRTLAQKQKYRAHDRAQILTPCSPHPTQRAHQMQEKYSTNNLSPLPLGLDSGPSQRRTTCLPAPATGSSRRRIARELQHLLRIAAGGRTLEPRPDGLVRLVRVCVPEPPLREADCPGCESADGRAPVRRRLFVERLEFRRRWPAARVVWLDGCKEGREIARDGISLSGGSYFFADAQVLAIEGARHGDAGGEAEQRGGEQEPVGGQQPRRKGEASGRAVE